MHKRVGGSVARMAASTQYKVAIEKKPTLKMNASRSRSKMDFQRVTSTGAVCSEDHPVLVMSLVSAGRKQVRRMKSGTEYLSTSK